jgi:hypothetical protein
MSFTSLQVALLLKVTKTNLVVMKLAAGGHKQDSSVSVFVDIQIPFCLMYIYLFIFHMFLFLRTFQCSSFPPTVPSRSSVLPDKLCNYYVTTVFKRKEPNQLSFEKHWWEMRKLRQSHGQSERKT